MLLNFILPVKSQQVYCEYSISLNSRSYHLKVLYSGVSLKAARKSLFSSLSNSLRKMTSQLCAKDKITAMSTKIIHGPYLSLKRDPPWPFSWVTASVSPDAWCWPARSILKVSKSRKKNGESDAAAAEGERRTVLSFFMLPPSQSHDHRQEMKFGVTGWSDAFHHIMRLTEIGKWEIILKNWLQLKRQLTQNENPVVVYSPSCRSKPVWPVGRRSGDSRDSH